MNRLTDHDKNFGPLTIGKWHKSFAFYFDTGDEEDGPCRNSLLLVGFGRAVRLSLPNIIPPWRIRHEAHWDADTVKRLGRNHFFVTHHRRFGFSLSDMGNGYDFLQIFFGAQTHDSTTTKDWCWHLPWKQWRVVRDSLYRPDGSLFANRGKMKWDEWYPLSETCPRADFEFADYDGEIIAASCRINEMEWAKGYGWFKWLKFFSKNRIRRSLDLSFSKEVGPENGSWKGGTIGHGIEMEPGETPEAAFRRYCQMEHRSRSKPYRLRFLEKPDPNWAYQNGGISRHVFP